MKIRVIYRFLPFRYWDWIGGMVIYPFILFKRSPEEITDKIFRHELEHIYQVRRKGWFKYYITYLYYSIKYGYHNNPYEVEAFAAQGVPLTAEERKIKMNI